MTPVEQLQMNMLEHKKGNAFFTQAECEMLLESNHGDIRAATYEGLIKKAEADSVTLPDGLKSNDGRVYWLSLASFYRPNQGKCIPRADEVV